MTNLIRLIRELNLKVYVGSLTDSGFSSVRDDEFSKYYVVQEYICYYTNININ